MNTLLTGLGFSNEAANIYLAATRLGTSSVQQLATAAKIKRPTAYNYIKELVENGWLEKVTLGKKELYHATNPQELERAARKQLDAIQAALPKLQVAHKNGIQSQVSVWEGRRAIEQLHGDIAQAKSIRFWSDLSTFEQLFYDATSALSEAIAKNGIRTKEIIANTPASKRSAKRYAAIAGKHYTCRVATKGAIHNNSAVYGNTVLIFRLQDNHLAVIRIDDHDIAETFQTLFDLAWESSEKYIPR